MAVHLFIIHGPRIQLIDGHRPNLIHVCNAQLPFRRVDRSRARRCVHKDGDDVYTTVLISQRRCYARVLCTTNHEQGSHHDFK
jgi:hypothetical protein